jgi:hypothetical protein
LSKTNQKLSESVFAMFQHRGKYRSYCHALQKIESKFGLFPNTLSVLNQMRFTDLLYNILDRKEIEFKICKIRPSLAVKFSGLEELKKNYLLLL